MEGDQRIVDAEQRRERVRSSDEQREGGEDRAEIRAFTRLPTRVAGRGRSGETATAKMRAKNTPSA
jgi:hypothetical protein